MSAPGRPRFDALDAVLERHADRLAERIAPLVVEQLAELLRERDEGPRMLSPAEAGERLGRSAEWVRAHRTELGVVELGDGPRPRLGVPLERLAAYLCSTGRRTEQAENGSGKRSGRRRAQTSGGREPRLL